MNLLPRKIFTITSLVVLSSIGTQCTKKPSTSQSGGSYAGGADDFYHADGQGNGQYGTPASSNDGEYSDIYAQGDVAYDDYAGDRSSYQPPAQAPRTSSSNAGNRQTTSTSSSSASYHTVQRGETLYRISKNYGTSVSVLQDANNIADPSKIFVGQELVIPR